GQVRKFFFMRPPRVIALAMAGTTNEKGEVTLGDLPQGTRLELGFDDERFASQGLRERAALVENAVQSPPVTVKLEAGATRRGVVRFGPTGQAAAGILVVAQATSRSMDAVGGRGMTD